MLESNYRHQLSTGRARYPLTLRLAGVIHFHAVMYRLSKPSSLLTSSESAIPAMITNASMATANSVDFIVGSIIRYGENAIEAVKLLITTFADIATCVSVVP